MLTDAEVVTDCDHLLEQNGPSNRMNIMRGLKIVEIEERIIMLRGQRMMLDLDLRNFMEFRPRRSIRPSREIGSGFRMAS